MTLPYLLHTGDLRLMEDRDLLAYSRDRDRQRKLGEFALTEEAPPKEGSRTPWGKADYVEQVSAGLWKVGTPGHGGYKLSKVLNQNIPEGLRTKNGWYEEDEEYLAIYHFFPTLFADSSKYATAAARYVQKRMGQTEEKKPPLGSGERFAALEKKLAAKGAENPSALAAWIGRKKYGKEKFAELSAKGRKRAAKSEETESSMTEAKKGAAGSKAKLKCNECGAKFIRSVSAGAEPKCPKCKGYDVGLAEEKGQLWAVLGSSLNSMLFEAVLNEAEEYIDAAKLGDPVRVGLAVGAILANWWDPKSVWVLDDDEMLIVTKDMNTFIASVMLKLGLSAKSAGLLVVRGVTSPKTGKKGWKVELKEEGRMQTAFAALAKILKTKKLPTKDQGLRLADSSEFMLMQIAPDGTAQFKHADTRNYIFLKPGNKLDVPSYKKPFFMGEFDDLSKSSLNRLAKVVSAYDAP